MTVAWRVLRRLLIFLVSLLVASIAVFGLLSGLSDPARTALGMNATEQAVAELNARWGLDRPVVVQYWDWVTGAAQGDFGVSYLSGAEIGPQLVDRLAVTLWLVGGAMLLSLIVAIPLGTAAAMWRNRWIGSVLSAGAQIGVAVPAFLVGMLLIAIFAERLGWFPSGGFVVPGQDPAGFLRAMTLPWIALGMVQAAVLTRYVRTAVQDEMGQDYLRTARSKGLTPWQALVRHGLRNAAIPILTVLGLQMITILVGAVVVEFVFTIPGIGSWLVDMVGNQDILAVQAIVITLVAVALLLSFLIDLAYTVIDPRLRVSK